MGAEDGVVSGGADRFDLVGVAASVRVLAFGGDRFAPYSAGMDKLDAASVVGYLRGGVILGADDRFGGVAGML